MARKTAIFTCQSCGATYKKWQGQCDACSSWNSIVEEASVDDRPTGLGAGRGSRIDFVPLDGERKYATRLRTGVAEFDRVTGGGLVPGSALLVGGDPGIGKSTILLQVAASITKSATCAYISGEEAVDQMRMRAERLGLASFPVQLAAATNLRDIVATLDVSDPPRLVIIDSIQTMYLDNLDSAPGSVSQVRATADTLIRLAKRRGFTIVLVGHVTKEGHIAGPRVLEHMVDTVLYFEGERGHQFRLMRAIKNRFGPTDEIGIFEMTGAGLMQVQNPSALFLAERQDDVSGAAVFAGIEGTRPVLVEIQALVSPPAPGTPRRAVIGWDSARLAMVLAVLEARCGISLADRDVYLNVAGGMRVGEPAADLPVAAALISAVLDQPLAADTVIFGEIGLSGEVRSVSQADLRLKEAAKLGFEAAWAPPHRRSGTMKDTGDSPKLRISQMRKLQDMLGLFDLSGAVIRTVTEAAE
ncbi:MAG: DNA repair protein RadA [Rhodospirillaceae bacterium]|nr:DNA repair protein RadA [Rhodospirillaceae bacterium]